MLADSVLELRGVLKFGILSVEFRPVGLCTTPVEVHHVNV